MDIIFPPINKYNENRKLFCPNIISIISPNNVFGICASLNNPSIEEDDDDDVVVVSGALANLVNGTGIDNENLSIDIVDSRGSPAVEIQGRTARRS